MTTLIQQSELSRSDRSRETADAVNLYPSAKRPPQYAASLPAGSDQRMLQFRERGVRSGALSGLRVRLASDSWTRRDAFALRHLCYHSEGFIDTKPHSEFSDSYDFSGNNATLVLYEGAEAIGSVRVCRAGEGGLSPSRATLPLAATFPDEFEAHIGGARAVEINRLVCHPRYLQNQDIVFALIRMADFLIRQSDPAFIAICVRTNHVGFWKRLRFQQVAGPRVYSGLKFATNLLVLPGEKCGLMRSVVPMLRISPAEADAYGHILSGQTVRVFGHD